MIFRLEYHDIVEEVLTFFYLLSFTRQPPSFQHHTVPPPLYHSNLSQINQNYDHEHNLLHCHHSHEKTTISAPLCGAWYRNIA
jgi:hypothetical protein